LSKFKQLSSSALHNRYILTNFSALSTSKLFLILEHTKSYIEKIHSIDSELAGHACKLHVKLQSLCGSGFSSVCCAHACQASPFRNELTNNTLWKQRWSTFLYP